MLKYNLTRGMQSAHHVKQTVSHDLNEIVKTNL